MLQLTKDWRRGLCWVLCRVQRGSLEWGCRTESPDAKAEDGKVGVLDISSPVNITTALHAAGLTLMQTFRKPGKEEGSRGILPPWKG